MRIFIAVLVMIVVGACVIRELGVWWALLVILPYNSAMWYWATKGCFHCTYKRDKE